MAQTQLPGTQVKDSSLKNVDIASDAAIDISKLALPTSLPDKATPVDADILTGGDSAASNVWKKFSWANIKATLKTYFDTIYLAVSSGNVLLEAEKTIYNSTGNLYCRAGTDGNLYLGSNGANGKMIIYADGHITTTGIFAPADISTSTILKSQVFS